MVFFGSNELKEYRAFWNVAANILDAVFMLCEDQAAIEHYKVKVPTILAFRREVADETPVMFGGNMSNEYDLRMFAI